MWPMGSEAARGEAPLAPPPAPAPAPCGTGEQPVNRCGCQSSGGCGRAPLASRNEQVGAARPRTPPTSTRTRGAGIPSPPPAFPRPPSGRLSPAARFPCRGGSGVGEPRPPFWPRLRCGAPAASGAGPLAAGLLAGWRRPPLAEGAPGTAWVSFVVPVRRGEERRRRHFGSPVLGFATWLSRCSGRAPAVLGSRCRVRPWEEETGGWDVSP